MQLESTIFTHSKSFSELGFRSINQVNYFFINFLTRQMMYSRSKPSNSNDIEVIAKDTFSKYLYKMLIILHILSYLIFITKL